ncbi:MAG: tRNA (adenosine(37)-N6)-dimethylallyltransferase MiaA [Pyrinomonadaceae bacterium]|nr:tRNA (adenosine(37)-N6)-dimethylallyltransferase MiaA [Pyrinomonadaceae bacterium]
MSADKAKTGGQDGTPAGLPGRGPRDARAPGVIAIVGPTASGKSTLGIKVALRLGGEIINCDSVQVYQGIQIATAKVPLEEREGIPHHLIDFVPPEINYTAGEWARKAETKIEETEKRGRVPILVGGTGLYLRALRNPFFKSPPTDEQLRRRISRLRERHGPEHLHRLLQRLDSASAKELYPRDWPRVQRAIEVRLQTGSPMSQQKVKRPKPHESTRRLRVLVLDPPRAELYTRINQRTEEHFAAGLVEEVEHLLAAGVPAQSNALGAHGYRRVVEYLEGKRDLASAIEQTKVDVRRYSKRQLTWFRRETGAEWFAGFGEQTHIQHAVLEAMSVPPDKA